MQVIRNLYKTVLRTAACLTTLTLGFAAFPLPSGLLDKDNPGVQKAIAAQEKHTAHFMQDPGTIGTAVGLDENGNPAVLVYIDNASPNAQVHARSIPATVDNIPARAVLTDEFVAYKKPSRGGGGTTNTPPATNTTPTTVSHTAIQSLPIQLGTSGGWAKDMANGYCCGGTLGSLVQVNGVQYILSNYHVFESDIVAGGNSTTAQTSDNVGQPGLIEVNCNVNNSQIVATLRKVGSLPNYNVDCGVAQVQPGKVSGSILEIGPISSSTLGASLNLGVKKSGRTTGFTKSTISGLNATIQVSYENECGGGTAFTKTFSGQIVVANSNNTFLNSGDSGSLLVENTSTNPRAVGLLFAGSSTQAIANPINDVLSFLGSKLSGTATMVGN
jgi:hypothetical protein